MKNLLTLLVFLIVAEHSYGQKIKFTDTGNVWLYNFSNKDLDIIRYNCYYLDTVVKIDTLEYRFLTSKIVYTNSTTYSMQKLIREDSLSRIYVRSLSGNDTAEQLLFDYNIQVGDSTTAIYGVDTFTHYLSKIDTVFIDNLPHRIFEMVTTSFSKGSAYKFIEGVGCTSGPFFPFHPENPESSTTLFCFTVNGVRPAFSKQIDWLNNTTSCHVSVMDPKNDAGKVDIYPQPATKVVHIKLPIDLVGGTITLYNLQGQLLYSNSTGDKEILTIENPSGWHGLFYYRISGTKGNNSFGKLLFE